MTENNGRVWQKKVMSGVTTQGRQKEEEVGTSLLGNDKNNVIVNYLFIKIVLVLKLSGLDGYLKSRINMLPKKKIYKFSVRCRFIKDICLLSFLINLQKPIA